MATIDPCTVGAKPLEMRFQGRVLSTGTGFIWRDAGAASLITNWHNVTGVNPWTGEHLSENTAAEPDELVAQLDIPGVLGSREPVNLRLRDGDGNPLWLEHPIFGRRADVIALPLAPMPGAELDPLNEMPSTDLWIAVAVDVVVLEYPFGISVSAFPIWKRASIASEPDLDIDSLPYFFIDTASRPGMSGAPVIIRSSGTHHMEGGWVNVTGQRASRFLGVYSGRIGAEDELKAQLGIVWRAEVVTEIIRGGRAGSIP